MYHRPQHCTKNWPCVGSALNCLQYHLHMCPDGDNDTMTWDMGTIHLYILKVACLYTCPCHLLQPLLNTFMIENIGDLIC